MIAPSVIGRVELHMKRTGAHHHVYRRDGFIQDVDALEGSLGVGTCGDGIAEGPGALESTFVVVGALGAVAVGVRVACGAAAACEAAVVVVAAG